MGIGRINAPFTYVQQLLTAADPLGNHAMHAGIRRITATPLYYKAENWRLDMPEISLYPASIYSTPWISG